MTGYNFMFVHWVLPLGLILAGVSAYAYFAHRESMLADLLDDPRLETAFDCTVEQMWVHQE